MKLIPIRKQNMPMMSLWGDMMERFFNEDIEQDSKMMAVDILESPQTYDIKANLPGIPKEKINISVKDNRILISASHEEVKEEKDKDTIIRTERYSGSYQRSISLPENANADNIKAKFENGVLSLTIPKREPTPKKEITIE
ncbi:MAG: Hsp20/alpha crystallin family protein [Candidatus Cloacimonadales bacterium]|jgi:HSP20 family protein|nr:Hsp20/alpha crystallin family protein [Candidatus Cloacimonadota bacterium]MDD3502301.1 Hsp20/alpha crystallin family protein [Candidatus Cloacimonadota bacterium]MDX9977987.1 Hsp20/alpha crystallin family protein [Candidatus Cloacimonadales bacterium]